MLKEGEKSMSVSPIVISTRPGSNLCQAKYREKKVSKFILALSIFELLKRYLIQFEYSSLERLKSTLESTLKIRHPCDRYNILSK